MTTASGGQLVPKIVVKSFIDLTIGNAVKTDDARCLTTRYNAGLQRKNAISSVVFERSNDEIRIRRLTPGECWKLQGFTDEDISKVKPFVSDHQMYRQAGNAVTVNVAEMIGKSIVSAIERNN